MAASETQTIATSRCTVVPMVVTCYARGMIHVWSGENSYSLRLALRQRIAEFAATHGDMAIEQLDGEDVSYDRMREVLQSVPFLASKKLVILRTPSAQKQFIDTAQALLEQLGDDTDVIIIEPKLDKRSTYYKYLVSHTDFQEYAELDPAGLARWLVEQATSQHGTLSSPDARYLVERCGANQQLLGNELQKLLLYDTHITRSTIDLLTEPNPQSTIFQLLDAMFAGHLKQATMLYEEQRRLKVEPQQIIAMLAWQLHIVALVKAAGDQTDAAIASQAKLSPFVVGKSRGIARTLSMKRIRELVHAVLLIDVKSKTGALDADEALRTLLITTSSNPSGLKT